MDPTSPRPPAASRLRNTPRRERRGPTPSWCAAVWRAARECWGWPGPRSGGCAERAGRDRVRPRRRRPARARARRPGTSETSRPWPHSPLLTPTPWTAARPATRGPRPTRRPARPRPAPATRLPGGAPTATTAPATVLRRRRRPPRTRASPSPSSARRRPRPRLTFDHVKHTTRHVTHIKTGDLNDVKCE